MQASKQASKQASAGRDQRLTFLDARNRHARQPDRSALLRRRAICRLHRLPGRLAWRHLAYRTLSLLLPPSVFTSARAGLSDARAKQMSRDRPQERCPECGGVYMMEYVGPQDDPHGHHDRTSLPFRFSVYELGPTGGWCHCLCCFVETDWGICVLTDTLLRLV